MTAAVARGHLPNERALRVVDLVFDRAAHLDFFAVDDFVRRQQDRVLFRRWRDVVDGDLIAARGAHRSAERRSSPRADERILRRGSRCEDRKEQQDSDYRHQSPLRE